MIPKHQRFAEEYLKDLNATQAAIRAGYSQKTAKEQGCRLLTNVNIAQRISELKDSRSKRTAIEADEVLKHLAAVGLYYPLDYIRIDPDGLPTLDFTDMTRDQSPVLKKFRVKRYMEGK